MRVLVYGTLKRNYSNNRFLQNAVFIGDDRVEGFMMKNAGFPAAMPAPGSVITGEIWDIGNPTVDPVARRTLAGCDMLEGYDPNDKHNTFYVRQEVQTVGGENVYMYVGQPQSFDDLPDWPHQEENGVKVYTWGR